LPIVEFGIRDCDGYGNITQIGIDDAVVGQAAADLLVRRGYKDFAFVEVADSRMKVDGSVRLVTRTRAYIAANFDRRLTVSQIAASVKASRRLLEMKFRQVTGGTVHYAVERVRMDEAKRLISCTNRPIGEIAAACGFGSDISFRFAFRRVYGVPPTFYRRQPSSPART